MTLKIAQTNLGKANRNGGIWLALDKLGALGAVLSAIAAPCCFPLFAAVGGWLGFGSVPFLRDNAPVLIQGMTALALVGQYAAYRQHRRRGPLLTSALSGLLVAIAYYISYHVTLIYCALTGLGISAVWNFMLNRLSHSGCCAETKPAVVLESVLTCPHCGHQRLETMPTDACVFFYDCRGCGQRLKPKVGDCCVFCSYGTVKCAPIQLGGGCSEPASCLSA